VDHRDLRVHLGDQDHSDDRGRPCGDPRDVHRAHPGGHWAHRDACYPGVAESDDPMTTMGAPGVAGESDDRRVKRGQPVAGAAGRRVLHRVQAGARVAAAQPSEACRRVWLDVVRTSVWDDHSK
jgi:hypothetical protein